MLIRLPERIRPLYLAGFGVLLAMVQIAEGSDLLCVSAIFGFIFIAGIAFNKVGGLTWPSGSYVFFYALLTMIVGVVWKAGLGEAVDSNLQSPQSLFLTYMVGMLAIGAGAVAVSRLRTTKPILNLTMPEGEAEHAAAGCFFTGATIMALCFVLPEMGLVSLTTFLLQINHFAELAVLLAVYYKVKETNGRASFSWIAVLSVFAMFTFALLSFSKQAIFTPFVCWGLGAAAGGYHITIKRLAIVSVSMLALFAVMVPYAQYGRNHRDEFSNPFEVMVQLALNPSDIMEKQRQNMESEKVILYHYYDENQGGIERLSMITLDDPLIEISNRGKVMGPDVILAYFLNEVPRVLLPNKPTLNFGNGYAHEIGLLSVDDSTTGISFSASAEAYHVMGWAGVMIVLPVFIIIGLWVADSMTGSTQSGPWPLLYLLLCAHLAPEGALSGLLYLAAQGTISVVVVTVFAIKLAPAIGSLVMGPAKRRDLDIEQQMQHLPAHVRRVHSQG